VQQLDNVYLYNVDDLQSIVRENVKHREQELVHCRSIIAERSAALMARFNQSATEDSTQRQEPDWAPAGAVACPR
jgi:glutamyl-tRNA reductase